MSDDNQLQDDARRLQNLMREQIPLCDFMQITIAELHADSIQVHAPIAPNRNLHGSAFAGSLSALTAVTGWALVTHNGQSRFGEVSVVVKKAEVEYLKPVTDEQIVIEAALEKEDLSGFFERIELKGRGSIEVQVKIQSAGETAVKLTGRYTLLTAEQAEQIKGNH